jgi:tetratricopeptide (TPR) repeat protein
VNPLTVSPYKGLTPYAEEDAHFFFGRQREQEIIAANLQAARLTILFGESGAGKSSVLRAGVMHDLRQLAGENPDESGAPGLAVAIFSDWRDDPLEGLKTAAREALKQAFSGLPVELPAATLSLAETLRQCAERAGSPLLVILDQFDEYFLYRDPARKEDAFAVEFPRLVMDRTLPVNFLISIRADAHDRLEYFKNRIPHIFDNSIRIEHLDRKGAREAIEKPIAQYNRLFAAGGERFEIEAELVAEVLRQLEAGQLAFDEAGRGGATQTAGIKTPFLQLVMTRLWEAEMGAGSAKLRLATLEGLGNASGIVGTHLESAMAALQPKEQEWMARSFRYLVTPSGTKIAYSAEDLAQYLQSDEAGSAPGVEEVTRMLETLSSSGARILNPVALQGDARGYEISHDVLAPAILRYVRKAEQDEAERRAERKAAEQAREESRQRELEQAKALAEAQSQRAREKAAANRWLKMLLALVAVLAITAVIAAWVATVQRNRAEIARQQAEQARRSEREAIERERRTNNQIIPGFAELLYDTENFEKTLKRFQAALEFSRQEGNRIREGVTLASIGQLYFRAGNYVEAAKNYEAALKILEAELPGHPYLAATLNSLAAVYAAEGKYNEASPLYQRAREMLEKTLGTNSKDVAVSLKGLATIRQNQSDFNQAEMLFRQALEIDRQLFDPNHQQVALDEAALAGLYLAQRRYTEAEALYRQAQTKLEQNKALGPNHSAVGDVLVNLGLVYTAQGRYGEAQPLLERAFDIHEKTQDIFPLKTIRDSNALAILYNELGRYNDAESLFKQTLPASEQLLGAEHPEVADTLDNFAVTYRKQGKCAQAEPLLQRALRIQEPESLDATYSLNNLADCYADRGHAAEAEQLYLQVLKIRREKLGEEKEEVAYTLHGLAMLYSKQGRSAEAESHFQRALAIREKALGADHPHLAETLEGYAAFLRKTKRAAQAGPLEARAKAIRARQAR